MSRLTVRQHEVLVCLAGGLTDRQIGDRLYICEITARDHVRAIRTAYGATNRAHAVALAMRAGDLT